MIRRRVLGFLGFSTAATVVGAGSLSAAPGMPLPPKEPEHHEDVAPLPIGTIVELVVKRGDQMMPNWLPCEGQLLAIKDYPELHKVLGVAFGGHAVSFGLPDYRPNLFPAVDANVGPVAGDFGMTDVAYYTVGRALGDGTHEAIPVIETRRYIKAR